MEQIQSVLSKVFQEIKSPRGGRYIAIGGVLVTVFGCIGFGISNAIAQGSGRGSAGAVFAALFLLMAILIIGIGVVITVVGGVMVLLQNRKTNVSTIESTPSTFTSHNLSSVESESSGTQPAIVQPASTRGLSIEQRREILQREIHKYLRRGYRVISQTDTTAQLVKPKEFSCLWFLINMLLLIGWIFYLAWYWSKRDTQVYIEVDINGSVKIRR
jgi:hypothetical protein